MNHDRIAIEDPPEYASRYESDDAPEQLGDDFELSVEEDRKIAVAANWGKCLIRAARAGDLHALSELQHKMHLTVYKVMR